jgi:multiple sugar transport system permease protein
VERATTLGTGTRTRSSLLAVLTHKNRHWLALAYVIVVVASVWAIFPFYWMLLTSVRHESEMYSRDPALWPKSFTLQHYHSALFASGFPRFFANSFLVAAGTTAVSVVAGAMAAYALTRLRFAGRSLIARMLVVSYLAPGSVLFIPLFALFVSLRLTNTLHGLALAHLTFTVPFSTWMLMGYFRTIPVELEEAALVDGATRWGALWRVVVPLSAPALVVVAVFSFTLSWNEFLYALVLVQRKELMTAPVGLTFFQTADLFYWGAIMAASTLMALLPVLLYVIGQRWVISGWTAGAVKH